MVRIARLIAPVLALLAVLAVALPQSASARSSAAFKETLSDQELKTFEDYVAARSVFDFKLDAYWREVSDKRALRKKRKVAKLDLRTDDYVQSFPPEYKGPYLPVALQKRWAQFQSEGRSGPVKKPDPLPTLTDFLSLARAHYGFSPERVPEREFKRRYAREALALGLTKNQVVRIYALETSGLGTADMVAGIHPITKKGSPISTAIGYAQLLAANTINEIRKSGPAFIERLEQKARRHPEQAETIHKKVESLKRMVTNARTVPDVWAKQVAHARTGKGIGMHAINIDGDVGPWLQAIKIKGLKDSAARNGRETLTGSQIELMNLAGPGTGLEMMRPAGMTAPTPNFFERGAYARNTIVRGKTSEQLLAALDERMNINVKNSGAVEFAEVFDELMAERQAQR
ncbi:MAG: hypothetical protein Q7T86_18745 [Hyphomicrobiaceae bacterium]|nr:hypothetical protein [Hyphomicrobiaceae bacterium]